MSKHSNSNSNSNNKKVFSNPKKRRNGRKPCFSNCKGRSDQTPMRQDSSFYVDRSIQVQRALRFIALCVTNATVSSKDSHAKFKEFKNHIKVDKETGKAVSHYKTTHTLPRRVTEC